MGHNTTYYHVDNGSQLADNLQYGGLDMTKDYRLTIRMDEGLADAIAQGAHRQGDIGLAETVRRALAQYYAKKTARLKHLTQRKGV